MTRAKKMSFGNGCNSFPKPCGHKTIHIPDQFSGGFCWWFLISTKCHGGKIPYSSLPGTWVRGWSVSPGFTVLQSTAHILLGWIFKGVLFILEQRNVSSNTTLHETEQSCSTCHFFKCKYSPIFHTKQDFLVINNWNGAIRQSYITDVVWLHSKFSVELHVCSYTVSCASGQPLQPSKH